MSKWYTCPICGKQFSFKALLMGHMRSHEKDKKGKQMGEEVPTKVCPRCEGSGKVWVTRSTGPDYSKTCPECGGVGRVPK